MQLVLILRSLHILSAIAMIGGVFARQIVRVQATRSADVHEFSALTAAAGRIERLLVIPGSLTVIVLGILLGLIMGAPVLGFIQGADRNWLLVANLIILSMLIVVRAVFLPQRRRLESALARAMSAGSITPELHAAATDPALALWHTYEMIAVVLVALLMSLRPF